MLINRVYGQTSRLVVRAGIKQHERKPVNKESYFSTKLTIFSYSPARREVYFNYK